MKAWEHKTLRPLLYGVVLGSFVTIYVQPLWRLAGAWADPPPPQTVRTTGPAPNPWRPEWLAQQSAWRRIAYDDNGWSARPAGTHEELSVALDKIGDLEREAVIPILPTVYVPDEVDKLYYDAIIDSDISPGDKVLVIGTGSGADSWAASLKAKAPIYVVEINPYALINAKLTARLAGFEIRAVRGDFRDVELPEDFRDFDFILWNMPFILSDATPSIYESNFYHDGDNGDILDAFLARLPSLLKEDGVAIALNYALAKERIKLPGVTTRVAEGVKEINDKTIMLFTIPNPGAAE